MMLSDWLTLNVAMDFTMHIWQASRAELYRKREKHAAVGAESGPKRVIYNYLL